MTATEEAAAVTGQESAVAMNGTDLITAERQRQIDEEGWTPDHDVNHQRDDLAIAAAIYATPEPLRDYDQYYLRGKGEGRGWQRSTPRWWPWHSHFWKPTPGDRVRELVKAGALIAAEIDRLRAVSDDLT